MSHTKLSDRIRPGSEAPPWVREEVLKLERRLEDLEKVLAERDGAYEDNWREQERLRLLELRELLDGAEVRETRNPLVLGNASYLDGIELLLERQPGHGRAVAERLRAIVSAPLRSRFRNAGAADDHGEAPPVAFVPIHPRNGPLWPMTTDQPSSERLPSYPLRALHFSPPSLRDVQALRGVLARAIEAGIKSGRGSMRAVRAEEVHPLVDALLAELNLPVAERTTPAAPADAEQGLESQGMRA